MIGEIITAILEFLARLWKTNSHESTTATDAPPTPDLHERFRDRVREWEAGGAGGPDANHPAGGTGHAGPGLHADDERRLGTLSQQGEH